MKRSIRRISTFLLAVTLAVAQLAVSAYACPLQTPAPEAVAMDSMPDCPDAVTTNLCASHCDYGSTSVDTHPFGFAHVAAVPFVCRIATVQASEVSRTIRDWRLDRSMYPPPPILFGVLRI